jgi:hypothetical protein
MAIARPTTGPLPVSALSSCCIAGETDAGCRNSQCGPLKSLGQVQPGCLVTVHEKNGKQTISHDIVSQAHYGTYSSLSDTFDLHTPSLTQKAKLALPTPGFPDLVHISVLVY